MRKNPRGLVSLGPLHHVPSSVRNNGHTYRAAIAARTSHGATPRLSQRMTGPSAGAGPADVPSGDITPIDAKVGLFLALVGHFVSNTGQVVAELKVVTSNKLCEPIL